jgi:hypothetical protein
MQCSRDELALRVDVQNERELQARAGGGCDRDDHALSGQRGDAADVNGSRSCRHVRDTACRHRHATLQWLAEQINPERTAGTAVHTPADHDIEQAIGAIRLPQSPGQCGVERRPRQRDADE